MLIDLKYTVFEFLNMFKKFDFKYEILHMWSNSNKIIYILSNEIQKLKDLNNI